MIGALLFPLRRLAMWAVWNVPVGRFARPLFDFAMGQKGQRQPLSKETENGRR